MSRARITSLPRTRKRAAQLRALQLRASGMDWHGIADDLGRPVGSCQQLVREIMHETPPETIEELRALESARLDELLEAVWQKALAGDVKAVDAARRLIETRAKICGVYSETVTTNNVLVLMEGARDRLRHRIETLEAAEAATTA